MDSNPPRRAGPLWLWLLALIALLAAVWVLVDGLTDDDFTGDATTPPAEEMERSGRLDPPEAAGPSRRSPRAASVRARGPAAIVDAYRPGAGAGAPVKGGA